MPQLLFRHICLLACITGLFAWREPVQGAFLFATVLFISFPRYLKALPILTLSAAFCCGLFYMQARTVDPPDEPVWLVQAVDLRVTEEGRKNRPPHIRIKAEVASISPQYDGRTRIILANSRPATNPDVQPYSGSIVWMWKNPTLNLHPGDIVEADLRLSRIRDFKNPGTLGTEDFWRDQNVFLRAWSQGDKPNVALSPESCPSFLFAARSSLAASFLHALSPDLEKTGLTPGQAVLPALIFGDRSFISPSDRDLFANATLAHSLALSGLHMGYMAAFGYVLALLICRFFPGVSHRMPRPMLALALGIPFGILYLWLGQCPISLARAFLMLVFWWFLLLWRHPKVILDGLFAALGVLLLIDPAAIFSISLQLSAISIAVIGLCLHTAMKFADRLFPFYAMDFRSSSGRIKTKCTSVLRAAFVMLFISCAIQIALSPLIIKTFGTAGILFPLNLLWLPILGVWVMPLSFAGLFCAAAGLETIAGAALYLASIPGDLLFSFLNFLDAKSLLAAPAMLRPHWLGMAGFWILCLAVPEAIGLFCRNTTSDFVFTSGRGQNSPLPSAKTLLDFKIAQCPKNKGLASTKLLIACISGCLLFFAPLCAAWVENQKTGVRLRMIDVGQGQSVCIEWSGIYGAPGSSGDLPSHGRVLVDGGGFPTSFFDVGRSVVAPALTDNSRARLNAVINTHPDTDHLGGLLYILEKFQVENFYTNGQSAPPSLAPRLDKALYAKGISPRTLRDGDILPLAPGLHLEVLWPPAGTIQREDSNANSIVLRLIWKNKALALLCGDIDKTVLQALLQANRNLSCQVLVLPHHGSGNAFISGFYEAATPALALAGCGYGNPWGFPAPMIRNTLKNMNIPLYTTAADGQILLEWKESDKSPSVSLARSGS